MSIKQDKLQIHHERTRWEQPRRRRQTFDGRDLRKRSRREGRAEGRSGRWGWRAAEDQRKGKDDQNKEEVKEEEEDRGGCTGGRGKEEIKNEEEE